MLLLFLRVLFPPEETAAVMVVMAVVAPEVVVAETLVTNICLSDTYTTFTSWWKSYMLLSKSVLIMSVVFAHFYYYSIKKK